MPDGVVAGAAWESVPEPELADAAEACAARAFSLS